MKSVMLLAATANLFSWSVAAVGQDSVQMQTPIHQQASQNSTPVRNSYLAGMQIPSGQQHMPEMQMPPGHQMPGTQPTPPGPGMASQQSSGSTLRLEDLEQMALKNNPTLAQAEAEIRAAAARKQQAGLYPNPTVGFDADEASGGPIIRGGQLGFFAQQNIVLGGKLGLNRQVFEQERRQAEVERDEQRLRVLNGVRLFFYQALAAQRIVTLDRELLRITQDAVETSNQLLNAGQADVPDLLQSQVEAQREEIELIAAEQNLQRAWTSLAASVGRHDLQPAVLEGNLEEIPEARLEQWLESILRDSPAVKIAELGVARAEAVLARARREPIPDLQLRGGLRQNRELLEPSGRPIGLQGFAEIGAQIPLFNRNQGNIQAAQADLERARQEVRRVNLLLRERSAAFFQNYRTARAAAERYRAQMIPWAQQAYQLYLQKYQDMRAAYPQVLISQRTLFQLQTDYISALGNVWTNSIALQGFLLTDGLEAPSRPDELDLAIREINMPSGRFASSQER